MRASCVAKMGSVDADDVDDVFSRDMVLDSNGIAESKAYVCFHHSDIRTLRSSLQVPS